MATAERQIELGRELSVELSAGMAKRPASLWLRLHSSAPLLASTGAAFVSTTATGVLGFVFWVVAARLYSPTSLGIASAAISAMFLIGNISRLGLDYTLAIGLPHVLDPRKRKATAMASLLVVAFAGSIVAILFVVQPFFSGEVRSLLTANPLVGMGFVAMCAAWGAGLVLDQLLLVGRAGQLLIGKNAAFSVVRVAALALALPLIGERYGILGATAVGVASGILVLWKPLGSALVEGLAGLKTGLREVRSMLRGPAMGNYFTALVSGLPGWVLPVLVVDRAGGAEAAHFYTAWMIVTLVNSAPSALAAGLLAEAPRRDRAGDRMLGAAYRYAAIFILPSVLGLLVSAPLILHAFGSGYSDGASVLLRYLSVGCIPYTAVQINFIRLRLDRKMGILSVSALLLSGVCLAGSYFLLPTMGLRGAGVAWLAGSTLAAAVSALGVFAGFRTHREGFRRGVEI